MNKAQIIETLAKAGNTSLKKAEIVVNAIFENKADALVQKEPTEIRGLGSFKVIFFDRNKHRTSNFIKVNGKKISFFKGAGR